MQLNLDAEAQAKIERHKAHLPDGRDLTLLVLKGHLLVEEGLNELITAACPQPQHILEGRPAVAFALKTRIGQALTGHLLFPGLWPMIEALNTLRNDLAHNLDSPKLQAKLIEFMTQRQTHMSTIHDAPIDFPNWDATGQRLRSDISLLVSQLSAGALAVRTLVKKIDPWQKMVDEYNEA